MKTKLQHEFEISYNLQKRVVRNSRIVTEFLPLTIRGVFYCDTYYPLSDVSNRYGLDFNEIVYEGKNILPVLDFLEALDDIYTDIIVYAPKYFEEAVA